jgi:hypothetical protein
VRARARVRVRVCVGGGGSVSCCVTLVHGVVCYSVVRVEEQSHTECTTHPLGNRGAATSMSASGDVALNEN